MCSVCVRIRWIGPLADPAVCFRGGGHLAKGPCQGTPKTKNSTDLNHYFLGRVQIHLKSIRLANGQEVLKIIGNMTEIGIFDIKEKFAFFYI